MSRSRSTRWRGSSLPRSTWRRREASDPPRAASATRARRVAASARFSSALPRKAALRGSMAVASRGMRAPIAGLGPAAKPPLRPSPERTRHPPGLPRQAAPAGYPSPRPDCPQTVHAWRVGGQAWQTSRLARTASVPPVATLTDSLPDSALTRLFAREVADGRATWFSLPGGASLYEAGEEADYFYLLRAGRLGAFRREEGHETQFLGVIRPGEPAGEMALVAGSPHTATVAALRDSEILALSRDEFFRAVEVDSAVMTELARLMILRTRQSATGGVMGEPSVFGFIGVAPKVKTRPLADDLASRISRLGYRVTVVGSVALQAPTEWFSNVERDHDFVLYVAEAEEISWKALVGRQGDRLFRVAYCADDPPPALPESVVEPLQAQQLVDLVLLHPAGVAAPQRSEEWAATMAPARLFHVREGSAADADRLARVLTGQSVGLVLSGGGARAYAHIGAVRALRERGVPIDFVGGVSMGAIIGAGIAMGWDDPELEMRIRKAFVDSS